ncbi:hypothetical protein M427DRAFT_170401 [Gonapodya prolifera JEL478]|uniref:rhomboid protease n=1 Tax=Gonapodya prolifera (strain JEL478) TaxID=1344416 RepID=A0A139B071_GONPJ|nr:hypothetical protein M427DRAFT_170401 [Gonapodya prolifera JEL478]|eukprot:KXS22340.1 hypothetical protein M427DRAFT_170401 [Gonapodya prolifera JEL478]
MPVNVRTSNSSRPSTASIFAGRLARLLSSNALAVPGSFLVVLITNAIYLATLFSDDVVEDLSLEIGKAYWKERTIGAISRILTSPFVHATSLHIIVNQSAFFALSGPVEQRRRSAASADNGAPPPGAFSHLWLVVVLGALSNIIFLSSLFILDALDIFLMEGEGLTMGLSGIVFALIVIHHNILVSRDAFLSPTAERRSIFGAFSVPVALYPWAALLVVGVLFPDISFLVHFAGVIVGFLYTHSFLNPIIILPSGLLSKMDAVVGRLTGASYAPLLPQPVTSRTGRDNVDPHDADLAR